MKNYLVRQMESKFLSKLIFEFLIDGRFVKLHKPFRYFSEILNQEIEIPPEFICDLESVPLLKATSARGGTIHDYFCRKDSIPVVTKQQAASIYLEVQKCRDELLKEGWFKRKVRMLKRNFKCLVVRVAPGYFHKLKVLATLEEVLKEV